MCWILYSTDIIIVLLLRLAVYYCFAMYTAFFVLSDILNMKILGLEIRKAGIKADKQLPSVSRESGENLLFYPNMSRSALMRNTTVSACVMLIADSIAQMSMNVYKRTEKGRIRDDRPNLSYLLRKQPNFYDAPFTFKQTIAADLALDGNAFIFVARNPDFSPKSLTPLIPEKVQIRFDENGDVYYEYYFGGKIYKYRPENILHIPAYRFGTIRGVSPLAYAFHAAKLGLTLDEYTNDSFDGGIHSKLLIEVPQTERKFEEADAKKLKERILSAYGGKAHANDPFIVANGMKASALDLSSNADAQLAENRTYSEREIAKIYRVPLYMLGKDDSKFTNQEQANTFFLQHTLSPWVVRLQQYFDRLLTYPFQNDHYVEFDTDTMLRADYKSRMEMYTKGLTNGVYTPNQIFERENLPKTSEAWGDQHFMPVNLSTVDKIAAQNVDDARKNSASMADDKKEGA